MAQEAVVRSASTKPKVRPTLWVAGALFVIGLALWIWQVSSGVLAYHAQYAWGIYIPAFFTVAAAAMGSLIFAGAAQLSQLWKKDLGIDAHKLYLAAIALLVAAGFIITADLGRPTEVFRVIISGGMTVPIFWDFWTLLACLVVAVLGASKAVPSKVVGVLSIAAGLALLFVESWLAASSGVQELWASTIGGSVAFAEMVTLGFAMVLLVGSGNSKPMGLGAAAALVVCALMIFLNMVVGSAGTGRLSVMWAAVAASPWFWMGVVVGIVAPIVFILLKGQKPDWLGKLDGALILLGAFCLKLCFITSSQYVPAFEGLSVASPEIPLVEIVVTVGFVALGYVVYELGLRLGKEKKNESE